MASIDLIDKQIVYDWQCNTLEVYLPFIRLKGIFIFNTFSCYDEKSTGLYIQQLPPKAQICCQ